MCGRGGVVGGATTTSQRGCVGSTGRRLPQGLENGPRGRRESGMEEEWRMDRHLEDEVESRKQLDEQRRKLQKELRDIDKFSCVPKEFGKPPE